MPVFEFVSIMKEQGKSKWDESPLLRKNIIIQHSVNRGNYSGSTHSVSLKAGSFDPMKNEQHKI